MTEPLTTRGPWIGGGFAVAWMLKSGQPDRGTRGGIRLTLIDEDQTSRPGIVSRVLTQEEAEELYIQLGKHLTNVETVPNIDGDTRDGVIPGITVSALAVEDFRKMNLEAVQDEMDNPIIASPATRGQNMIRTSEVEGWTREEREAALRNVTGTRASRADRPTGRRYTIKAWLALSQPSED